MEVGADEEKEIIAGNAGTKENVMGTEPVKDLLIRMSLPIMASMLVQALYNIVDSYFVSKVSQDAFTAVSMSFPIQTVMMAFAIGTSLGMSALMSRSLGAGDFARVNTIAKNGIFLSWCTFAVFFLVGFFAESFFIAQTNDPVIIKHGTDYLSVVCWFSISIFTQVLSERLLQGTGKTKYILFIQGSGALINCILDPIFIFGMFGLPRLEARGAAIATVIAQTCGAAIGIYFNIKKNTDVYLNMKGFRPSGRDIKAIYKIGVPTIIMQTVGSVMVFGYNQILFTFSKTAVATFGAFFKLQSFVFMPIFGMNTGLIPIVAYNYGAKKRERMEEAMRISVRYGITLMTIGTILFWVFPVQLLKIFSASDEMAQIGIVTLRTISLGFPCAGYAIMRGGVFQALGKSIYSMYISVVRQLVVLLPAAFLLSRSGNINYVWFSFPVAEIAGITMSIYFSGKIRKEIVERI